MKSNRGKLVRAAIFGLLYYAACIVAIFCLNFAAKVLAYIAAQFIFRGMVKDALALVCIGLFALFMCVSVVCFALIVKNTNDG